MKRFLILILIFASLLFFLPQVYSQYEINFQIKGASDSEIYIGHHYGKERILLDTIYADKNGKAVFKGNTALKKGIYLAVVPNFYYFEFLVADTKKFSLKTDVEDYVYSMKVKGCSENILFNNYQRFMFAQHKKRQMLEKSRKANIMNKDSLDFISKSINEVFEENELAWKTILKETPNTFFASIVLAMTDPEIPEEFRAEPKTRADSIARMIFFRTHFFDHIDFSQPGLLNTPVYYKRLQQYFTQMFPMNPDSIISAGKNLIENLSQFPTFYNYTADYLLDFQEATGIMAMEKVFMDIATDYFLTGKAKTDSSYLSYIKEKLIRTVPNQFGFIAKDLKLESPSGEYFSLSQVNAELTVLVFYEPDCGICKTELPALKKLYNKYHDSGLEVYAVYTLDNNELWQKYIEDNELFWINTWDPDNLSNYHYLFYVDQTPTIYVLDKGKRIIAKKVNTRFLESAFEKVFGF